MKEPKEAKRIDARDWGQIADYACDTLASRKHERQDVEKCWKEVDRQIAMRPDVTHKLLPNGNPDPTKAWMPELELPLQAQALEVLTADARRMMSPDSGPWFLAHGKMTDEYLEKVDFKAMISGDANEVPSQVDQDTIDHLVGGVMEHWHKQYDFWSNMDQINAEAFKYGIGLGRARIVSRRVFLDTADGTKRLDQKIPVLVPMSIKNTYPDDSKHRLMGEGHWVGPSVVREWKQLLADVLMAASKGSSDPNDDNGGWMPSKLQGMEPECESGNVTLVEIEGDFIVSRKTTGDMYLPNAIATVVVGKRGKNVKNEVVRFRFRKHPFSSYIWFPYHSEHIDSAYPSSPLIKGWPIQKSAVNALSRMIEAAALQTHPPLQYDKDDPFFAQSGGAVGFPGAQWGSAGDVIPRAIGDASAMFAIYSGLLQQYADTTGINAPRLGAQTVSHTTAFAKDMEMQRGVIRTVDYVRSALKGGLQRWLTMAYTMGREVMKDESIYIDAFGGYVDVSKDTLPEHATFEVFGSGGPQEEAAKRQQKMQALQMAMQVDQVKVQMGGQPGLNLDAIQAQMLREGGWTDIDAFLSQELPGGDVGMQIPGILSQSLE